MHQPHRALQGHAGAFDAQHLAAHAAHRRPLRFAAHAARIDRHIDGVRSIGTNDAAFFNAVHRLAFMPLPAQPVDVADVEATTVRDRLDIKAGRAAIDSLATSLGLTRATGFVNDTYRWSR